MIESLTMYPEFATKFWENLKLAYNLCDESQSVRVHDMRNYTKNKSQDRFLSLSLFLEAIKLGNQ